MQGPTEILKGVFLGDLDDAYLFKGAKVTVHEGLRKDALEYGGHWVPIVVSHKEDTDNFTASRPMLDAATSIVRHYQQLGESVLLHCVAGVERSPLAMAYFLKRYGYQRTIADAYTYIRKLRPQVMERTHWLPPAVRKDREKKLVVGFAACWALNIETGEHCRLPEYQPHDLCVQADGTQFSGSSRVWV